MSVEREKDARLSGGRELEISLSQTSLAQVGQRLELGAEARVTVSPPLCQLTWL